MRLNPLVALSGDRNECPSCGKLFSSTFAFDKHRRGKYPVRRCLTDTEMLAKGMARSGHGGLFWVSALNLHGF